MPAFYLLAIIAAVFLWFALSFLFKPVGKIFHSIFTDAVDVMNEDDEENETKGD